MQGHGQADRDIGDEYLFANEPVVDTTHERSSEEDI